MSEVPYAFSKPLAIQVRNLVRQQGQTGVGVPKNLENRRVAIAIAPVGGVPARSSNIPGTALITLCKIDGTNGIVTTSVEETAYNLSGLAVTGNAYIVVNREYISGKWVVVMESCEVTE